MAPHSSTLAWKIPWTEEPGRLQSMGSLRSRTRLSKFITPGPPSHHPGLPSAQKQHLPPFPTPQFSSIVHLCPTFCHPMDCSTPGFPVHHQLLEFTENEDHGIRSHHFMGNRWGNSGNSVRLYFLVPGAPCSGTGSPALGLCSP